MEVKWNPEEGRSIYLCETQTIYSLIALCTDEITVTQLAPPAQLGPDWAGDSHANISTILHSTRREVCSVGPVSQASTE